MKTGEIVTDERDVWVVVGVQHENGREKPSLVRVGSLAHQVIAACCDQVPRP